MGNLSILRAAIPTAQVSSYTTGSITLPSARGQFVEASFDWIATGTSTGSSSEIVFSDIPQTYTNLMIYGSARAQGNSEGQGIYIQFNSDTAANYNYIRYAFERKNTTSNAYSAVGNSQNGLYFDVAPDTAYTTNLFGGVVCDILNYSSSSDYKTLISEPHVPFTSGVTTYIWHHAGAWMSNSAITSLRIYNPSSNNFVSGSTYSLYGVR